MLMTVNAIDNVLFMILMVIVVLYAYQFHKLMGLLEKRQPKLYVSIGKPKVWTIPFKTTPKGKYTPYGIFRPIPKNAFPNDKVTLVAARKNLSLCRLAYTGLAIYWLFVIWRIVFSAEQLV